MRLIKAILIWAMLAGAVPRSRSAQPALETGAAEPASVQTAGRGRTGPRARHPAERAKLSEQMARLRHQLDGRDLDRGASGLIVFAQVATRNIQASSRRARRTSGNGWWRASTISSKASSGPTW